MLLPQTDTKEAADSKRKFIHSNAAQQFLRAWPNFTLRFLRAKEEAKWNGLRGFAVLAMSFVSSEDTESNKRRITDLGCDGDHDGGRLRVTPPTTRHGKPEVSRFMMRLVFHA